MKIKRRATPLKTALILLAMLFLFACGGDTGGTLDVAPEVDSDGDPVDPTPARKPNILVLMADDLGFNDLAINNGNSQIHTPNMDQIAREGVRFTRHYASSVCSPARAAFLTGLYPERLGFQPNALGISPDVLTLPERLQQLGYVTWHIGKWHVGVFERTAWPDHQGFDHWFGFLTAGKLLDGHVDGELMSTGTYWNPWLQGDTEPGTSFPGHLDNILTDKAITALSELHARQKPWFLNLWFSAPHGPIQPDSEFAAKYPDTGAGKYRALVNQLDTNIGRIRAHLERLGALDDTIIVVVSDNGGTATYVDSNTPYGGVKASMTEGGLRTPLIIRWPDESMNGQVVSDIVTIEDIYPTLLAALDESPPDNLDGNSFYAYLQHREPVVQKTRVWELNSDSYGVLSADGRWRLLRWYLILGNYPVQIFDLELDPTSKKDVQPFPESRHAQMVLDYQAWYRDVHTVSTTYLEDGSGVSELTGTDFLRTPGFGDYTFGIGIPHAYEGQIARQAGVWELSRIGNTVTARFGDLTLKGDIAHANSCHSIVISGNFRYKITQATPPARIRLTLTIDGAQSQYAEVAGTLAVPDYTAATILGDPGSPDQSEALSPPVILNTALDYASNATDLTKPWTLESFSEELCSGK